MILISLNQKIFVPRIARQRDDTEGVEDISPGLPDSVRATPGSNPFKPSFSREARRAKASIFHQPDRAGESIIQRTSPTPRQSLKKSLFIRIRG